MPLNIFKSKSQREITELEKMFEKVIDDLFKNYESYSPEQVTKLEKQLESLLSLDKELNGKKPSSHKLIQDVWNAFTIFFGKKK